MDDRGPGAPGQGKRYRMGLTPEREMLVIGVGNDWRSDDAAGLLVVRDLQKHNLSGAQVCEIRGGVTDLHDAWAKAAVVIVVDAVSSGGPPGRIHRLDPIRDGIPARLCRSGSSHAWGVAESIAVARVFRELPPRLIIYGIEGQNFAHGQDLTPAVAAAIPAAAQRIREEVRAWRERVAGGG